MKQSAPRAGSVYRHFRNGHSYRVLGIAKHSETLEELVVYEALYDNPDGRLWVRPLGMFTEQVKVGEEMVARFALCSDAV